MTATREAGGTSLIEINQSGRGIARASLAQGDTQPLTECSAIPSLGDGPISSELVHRADRRNIAVGPLTIEAGRVWTRVREQGSISGLPPRAAAVASILEAARQFAIAILHRWGEHPLGTRMIFVGPHRGGAHCGAAGPCRTGAVVAGHPARTDQANYASTCTRWAIEQANSAPFSLRPGARTKTSMRNSAPARPARLQQGNTAPEAGNG